MTDSREHRLAVLAAGLPALEVKLAFRHAEFPVYDNSLLDPELIEKLTQRAKLVSSTAYTTTITPRSWYWVSGSLQAIGVVATIFGLLTAGADLADNLIGASSPSGGRVALLAAVVMVVGLAMLLAGIRIATIGRGRRTHPLNLDATEIELIEKALVIWPRTTEGPWTPPLLADPLRRAEVEHLRNTLSDRSRPDATEAWPEAHAVGIARVLARRIRASPAYSTQALDTLRVDVDRLVTDIDLRAYRILKARTQLAVTTTTDTTGLISEAVETAWVALMELIEQLDHYHSELVTIEQLLITAAELDNTPPLRELSLDDIARQLLRDATASTFDTDALAAHASELTDLQADLTARIAFLRDLLHTSTLPILPTAHRDSRP